MSTRTLFHSLSFDDVEVAMAFLTAVGFTEAAVYRDDSDPSRVVHAQFNWRDTGGVMFGSRRIDNAQGFVDGGHGQCYCVLASDADVDRVYDAALAAGATSVQAPRDEDYGGRGCSVRDAEGNQWSFGSYPGA